MTDSPGWTPPGSPGQGAEAGGAGATPEDAPRPPETGWAAPAPGWSAQQPPAAPGWGAPPPGPPAGGPGWGPPPGGPGWGPPAWGPPPGWGGPYLQAAKPGVIPLRPLSIGEILDGAFATMRAHWKVMLGVALGLALAAQVINVPLQWLIMRDVHVDPESAEITGAEVGATGLSFGLQMLTQILATGMLTLVVSRAVLGRAMTAGDAWRGARPRVLPLLGLLALTALIVGGCVAVGMLPGLLLMGTGAGPALVGLGAVAGLVAAVHFYVALSLAPSALVLEKQPVLKAMARSRKLVRGSWWRVLWVHVLIGIIGGIVGYVTGMPFLWAADPDLITGGTATVGSLGGNVLVGVGQVVSATLTLPFTAAGGVLLYIDQRMRREALDLELARAAGLVGDDVAGDDVAGGPAGPRA